MAKVCRLALLSLVLLSLPAVLHAQAATFGAVLTPEQEAPTPRDTPGFGNATLTLDAAHTSINVKMTIAALTTPVNNAHIHKEVAGVAGPVVVNFFPATNLINGRMDTTFTIEKALGDDIYRNPQLYYVNVHSTQFGLGEIRGQLTPIQDVRSFAGELRGSNEVPANASTAVGSFFITIDPANNLDYEVNIGSLQSPTLAHIHPGAAGQNNPPSVNFATSAAQFVNGRVTGTIQISQELADQIRANPGNFYVNVHTAAIGAGEIRGQIANANEYDVALAGRVTGGTGTTFVTDVRVFNPSYTNRAAALLELLPSGLAGNTAAAASRTVDIAPRATAVLDDIAGTSGFNITGTGAIRVTSASPIVVTSRIYGDLRSSGRGTSGQAAAAGARSTALRRGVIPQLSNRAGVASGYRTNIGFFNPSTATVFVRLELRDASGALIAESTPTLTPLQHRQNAIGDFFAGVDLSDRSDLTLSFDASAPIFVYGSVVDNTSDDPVFVAAQEDVGVAASQ
jgi:hypothetical protein